MSGNDARGGFESECLTLREVRTKYSAGPTTGVFTDGSSIPNPGPGGWGFVHVIEGEIVAERHGHHPDTTNNRMELTALIEAYKHLPVDAVVTMHSDSNLCVQTVNQWAASWERQGWKRKTGPIANLELVKELYHEHKRHPKVKLIWVKAHNGWLWNEYADALSTAWMRGSL
jgi:ribonuclease HI